MEIALIKLLTNNTTLYNNYSNYIYNDKYLKHIKDNNKYIYKIFVALKELKTKCTDTSNHSVSDLEAIFYSLYPVQKDGDRTIYKDVFNKIEQEVVSEDAIRTLLERFREVFVSREIATLAFDVSEARKPFKELQDKFAELESAQPEQQESLFLDTDIDKLFSNPETVQGVRWKLNCLNKAIGSLRKGNFGFVYARPETGKTAFLITTVMNVLKQNDKPVLWVNNEEASKDVLFRCYYHHFKISFKQLKDNYHYYKQEFEKIYGSRLMFIDNAAVQKRQIEQAVKELNPGFMVIDQLDKVHGFGNNDRYDLLMKQKYQWGRELAKVYCPVIGTCQAGGTGENKKWLQLNDVDSSHTAKQGEADFIIGIGKIDEEGFEDTRYLHVLKNKLPGDEDSIPELRHAKLTVHLDAEHSDYVDKHF